MQPDFLFVYHELDFIDGDSVRLQYANFIIKYFSRVEGFLTLDDVFYRLRLNEPIEYVFSLSEFCGNQFYVDKRVLIPRIETEELVCKAIKLIENNPTESFTIVDVGTGSGCIILSIANYFNNLDLSLKLIGIDISEEALEVAEINRTAFGLNSKVQLIQTFFQEFDFSKYENLIICSNLPYIPAKENLQESVINFEPHLALFGGEKGDELNKLLIKQIENLKNVKALFIEGYNGEIKEYLY